MEPIKIAIVKEGKDILVTSTEGGQIRITQNNNELKASETLEFLNYTEIIIIINVIFIINNSC